MPPRTTYTPGTYWKRNKVQCVWCGEAFKTNHYNATTCSGKCRSRLHAFRQLTGFDPHHPPGPVTAYTAYLDLLAQLLAAERVRRLKSSPSYQPKLRF